MLYYLLAMLYYLLIMLYCAVYDIHAYGRLQSIQRYRTQLPTGSVRKYYTSIQIEVHPDSVVVGERESRGD